LKPSRGLVHDANATLASETAHSGRIALLPRYFMQQSAFMEQLVLNVLTRMGYGDGGTGTAKHLAGRATRGSTGSSAKTRLA
jgi:restriction endonuclease Mrr